MSGAAGLVGGVVGGVIGFTFGNPQLGWMVGSSLGGLFGTKKQGGPDMVDIRPQTSEYGRPIPIIYSTMAVGGNVIWAADLIKVSDGDQGGKGGTSSPTGPTYAANFAVLICEAPGGGMGLGRIWAGADKRLIYDPATGVIESGAIAFYDGSESQMPDPLIESFMGAGNVPAYRGYCYVVIEMFDVSKHDGHRIPFLTIEVAHKVEHVEEHLGVIWFDNVFSYGDYFVSTYNGGNFGVLKHRKADMTFVQNRQIPLEEYGVNNALWYDGPRDTLVRVLTGQQFGDQLTYTTTILDSGLKVAHAVMAIGVGETLVDACFSNALYVFAFRLSSGGVRFYFADPSLHAITGSPITIDAGSTDALRAIYSINGSSQIYGITSAGRVRRYDIDGSMTSSFDLGACAPSMRLAVRGDGAVDPETGYLWTISKTSTTLTWTVHTPTGGLLYTGSQATTFYALARRVWMFAPGKVWATGQRWLSIDHAQQFDQNTGAAIGGELDGVYHGINHADVTQYNDVTGKAVGYRENGYYALGATDSPVSLPYLSGYLGAASVAMQPQTLAEVVTDLSLRAGLSREQIDVTDLTDLVDGCILANQVTVRDAIAALMPAYFFDAVEDQGVLRFIKRGGDIVVEIPEDDLGAHDPGEDVFDLYETTRAMDEELPRTFSVNYILEATKYSAATKYARRLVGYSGDESRVEMPMVFSDLKAQQIADVNLHYQWVSRISYKLKLGRKYAYLMPTDIVGLPGNNGEGYTARLTKVTQKDNGILEFDAVQDDSDTYVPHVIVEETPPPDDTVSQPSLTMLELM